MNKFFSLAALAVFAGHGIASAEVIYAINGDNELLSFDSAAPAVILGRIAINSTEDILNIDFRPATAQLFGLGRSNGLFTINLATGAATLFGTANIANGFDFGFDFNPTVDRIRVVTDAGENFRLNPITGATTTDLNLDYVAGDANANATPFLVGAAYTNNMPSATTTALYTIDSELDTLARSTNANNGTYVTQGALGVDVNGQTGFDISGLSGTAYASVTENLQNSVLYTIDLTSGTATPVGAIGAGSGENILDIAAPIPEPASAAMLAVGALGMLARRRRA